MHSQIILLIQFPDDGSCAGKITIMHTVLLNITRLSSLAIG